MHKKLAISAFVITFLAFLYGTFSDYKMPKVYVDSGETLFSIIDSRITHSANLTTMVLSHMSLDGAIIYANSEKGSGDTLELKNNIFTITGPDASTKSFEFLTTEQRLLYKFQRIVKALIVLNLATVFVFSILELKRIKSRKVWAKITSTSKPIGYLAILGLSMVGLLISSLSALFLLIELATKQRVHTVWYALF